MILNYELFYLNKGSYSSIGSISDSDIQKFNVLLLGFTPSQLSQLKITTTNTIQLLGSLNKWSSDQVSYYLKLTKLSQTIFIFIII